MNNLVLVGVAGVVTAGAICAIFYLKRRNNQIKYATEQVDAELQFEDVVSYFRSLNLKEGEDSPFVANCDHKNVIKIKNMPNSKDGYKLLFAGVYNSNKDIICGKFIYSLGWSEQLIEIMGNEPIVVLS